MLILSILFNLSFLFFILGMIEPSLAIHWGEEEKKTRKKVSLTFGIIFLILFSIYFSFEKEAEEERKVILEEKAQLEQRVRLEERAKIKDEERKEEKEEMNKKEEEKNLSSDVKDVNYFLMWHYYDKNLYENENIRIAGKVDYIGKRNINIRDGLEGITGNIYLKFNEKNIEQLDDLDVGDYIIAEGKVSHKATGQISIHNVEIKSVGEFPRGITEEYKRVAKGVLGEERAEKQKEEKEKMLDYKANVIKVEYKDLIREPYKYVGEAIEVEVDITQLIGAGILKGSGYLGKEGQDEWYVSYTLPEHSSRILEGDKVKFYGEFDDVRKIKRKVTREEVFLPTLDAKYFEFQ